MASNPHPSPVSNSIRVTLQFAKAGESPGQAFVIRFAVAPKVGDVIQVDENSVRGLTDEDLHVTEWTVVDVRHQISLDIAQTDALHVAGLIVVVNPK